MSSKKFSFSTFYFSIFCLIIGSLIIIAVASKSTYSASDATNACSKEAVLQLAKILYNEVGADCAVDSSENFFMRITTASIVLNNANRKSSGATWYNRIYNLDDNTYQGYSTYKDNSFETVVKANKNELLYIAQLVLSGKYNVPNNMTLQASQEIVEMYGTTWDYVETFEGFYDTFFGYENGYLSTTDVFGNNIENTSKTYFRNLAETLKLDDYSAYTVDNICQVELGNQNNDNDQSNNEVQNYTVNFYMNDGSNNIYKSVDVVADNLVNVPEDPTRDNYQFSGWKYVSGDTFDSNTKINSNLNLYADWEEIINDNTEEDNSHIDVIPTPSVPENNDNQNVDETPPTGDNHLFIIILGIVALDISIYFYKKRSIGFN